MVYKDLGSW